MFDIGAKINEFKTEHLDGAPKALVEKVDATRAVFARVPPWGVGLGVGVGCGVGIGWQFKRIRTSGLGPPMAFFGCGVGFGGGIGLAQGFGRYIAKDQRSEVAKKNIEREESQFEEWVENAFKSLFGRDLNDISKTVAPK